jgi:hypothetical protein
MGRMMAVGPYSVLSTLDEDIEALVGVGTIQLLLKRVNRRMDLFELAPSGIRWMSRIAIGYARNRNEASRFSLSNLLIGDEVWRLIFYRIIVNEFYGLTRVGYSMLALHSMHGACPSIHFVVRSRSSSSGGEP